MIWISIIRVQVEIMCDRCHWAALVSSALGDIISVAVIVTLGSANSMKECPPHPPSQRGGGQILTNTALLPWVWPSLLHAHLRGVLPVACFPALLSVVSPRPNLVSFLSNYPSRTHPGLLSFQLSLFASHFPERPSKAAHSCPCLASVHWHPASPMALIPIRAKSWLHFCNF